MKKNKIDIALYFGIFFLTFLGYYAILLLLFNLGLSEASRSVTIPIRLGIVAMLALLFLKNIKHLQPVKGMHWFLLFCFVYLYRLFDDYNSLELYYMSIPDVLLFFLSFAVIPFIVLSTQPLSKSKLKAMFNALFIGGLLFSALVLFFYSRFIGQVSRLASGTAGESVLSPLALSYSSALVIGVFTFYLLFNKVSFLKRILMLVGIGLATVPFFLGASRGALIALGIPFILYFLSGKTIGFKIRSLILLAIIVIGVIYLDQYFSSGLLNRFLGISEAIETGASSASRIDIWKASFEQFLNNPIFGDKLKIDGVNGYAHNIILEVLQTTGLMGFIPFIIVIINAWKICLYILKHHKAYFWIPVIFIQAFFMNMFSGAIYNASWFWTSMALLLCLGYSLKKINYYE